MRNRDRGRREFRVQVVDAAWRKGAIVPATNPDSRRRDTCGATIERVEYGKETATGWEIDHIVPKARRGADDLANLQPLHWENNRHKGNDHPRWDCLRRG